MKVLTFVDGRWETVNVGEFDSDGPQIEDLNGDGAVELVGKDESFDYAFASYAEILCAAEGLPAHRQPHRRRLANSGIPEADPANAAG